MKRINYTKARLLAIVSYALLVFIFCAIMIGQLASAVSHLSRKKVVHRDIKPSNLLLDDENTVKILDMGLARIGRSGLNENAQSMHLTTTGQVMGTVDYMAPEQATDFRVILCGRELDLPRHNDGRGEDSARIRTRTQL